MNNFITTQEEEHNFQTFFETIDDIVVVGDKDGQIFYVNQATSRKLGYSQEELLKLHILDLNPKDKRQEAEEIFAEMFAGKRNYCPLPLQKKDGSLLPVETRVWFGKWNGKECIFGICRDLSKEHEALQKFTKLFDNNPSIMAISDAQSSKIVDINKAFTEKLGYSKDEVIGKSNVELNLFFNPEERTKAGHLLNQQGFLKNMELMIRCKNGTILNGLFSGEVIESQGKNYFLTVMVDITEQILLRNKIEEQKKRLENVIEGAQLGTWEWNIQTGETVFNDRWADIIGYTKEELGPISIKTWEKVAHPDDLKKSYAEIDKYLSGKIDHYECEVRIKHKNGKWITILDKGKIFKLDEFGKPLLMAGTHLDITERILIEQMKTDFISITSHQLRTPITAIEWLLQLLKEDKNLSSAQFDIIEKVLQSVDRMKSLITALLNIARIESGRMIIKPKSTQLSQLLESVIEEVKPKYIDKKQIINLTFEEGVNEIVLDEKMVRNVYLNLLTNALKYSPANSTIQITITRKDNFIISEIKDQGYGIPDYQQSRVFEKFFRGDNIIKKESDGTGLGLYLNKLIIVESGGKIWFESEENKGTTFWFSLPIDGVKPKQGEVTLDTFA